MTAKRFKVVNLRDNNVCDIQDTSQELLTFYNDLTYNFGSAKAICDLLNELHEKNNELRLQLNLCSDQRNEFHRGAIENANRVGKLEKENEELKDFTQHNYSETKKIINNLQKENKQLKQIILFANELIKTQHITQHDYWKFRTLCKQNGVDL